MLEIPGEALFPAPSFFTYYLSKNDIEPIHNLGVSNTEVISKISMLFALALKNDITRFKQNKIASE